MVTRVLVPDETGGWLVFTEPREILTATSPDKVVEVLARAESAAQEGFHVAGYVTYEAASAFDAALAHHPVGPLPLLSFGVFDTPRPATINIQEEVTILLAPDLPRSDYELSLNRIRGFLADGDTYQVNFTQQMRGRLHGEAESLMAQLAQVQPTPYAMMIESSGHIIFSISPELFFERTGNRLRTEPMKGTRPRGRFIKEDQMQYESLAGSGKDRAENLMIVDMIRNDLGRVADTGSVHVDEMFRIRALPTVWQQVSSVSAETGASLSDIFSALFPCASVTGAPRARTMEIISELESGPRGVYTGAVGMIRPGGDCRFAVAIRTLLLDKKTAEATYGVGGGIVWDSDTEEEWQEALVKASVLGASRPDFQLFETMRFEVARGFQRLDYHMSRLTGSAKYFDFSCPQAEIRRALDDFQCADDCRVRLLLDRHGAFTLEQSPLPESSEVVRLRIASAPVDSQDVFLFHKTTHRTVYDEARASVTDCDDVLLFNEKGELTETSIANVFLEVEGQLLTPPVFSGLLAGTLRQAMLDSGEAKEAILKLDDLERADGVFVANSLRGLRRAIVLSNSQ
ncbi:MAG: aminodeoxychorismate synthase component I [Pseudomonadales bacterium]|jgi:para-aminobenzoate synthetase/4-amino-4-deoxychorismate lyase|nr:aminodeoxychorismate synthase component I [Pseudomonadales bacterium]